MSCEVTVAVTLGPEGDPLVLPSTCSNGLSWTKMVLPDWEFRYTYAPPSIYVPGNVLLAVVQDSGAVPMTVSVEGTSLEDLEAKKAELETALKAWPGLFQVDATDDNGTVTIAGPWESFPTLPRWGDVLPTVLGHYLLEATFSLPVNPTEAPSAAVGSAEDDDDTDVEDEEAVPRTPATPTTTATTTTTISEAWIAVPRTTSYNLEVSANGTTGWTSVYSGSALAFTDTGLDPDTDYYYRVTASNANGASSPSGVRHAVTAPVLSDRDDLVYGDYEPDATNTGVLPGTTLTAYNASSVNSFTLPSALDSAAIAKGWVAYGGGMMIKDKIIYGDMKPPNAQTVPIYILNSRLVGGAHVPTGDDGVLNCASSARTTTSTARVYLIDCEIDPRKPANGRDGVRGRMFELYRCDIHNVVDGVGIFATASQGTAYANVKVKGCYIHNLTYTYPDTRTPSHTDGTHSDCIQHQGGRNVEIIGNSLHGTTTSDDVTAGSGTNPQDPWLVPNGWASGSCLIVQNNTGQGVDLTTIADKNWFKAGKQQLTIKPGVTFYFRDNHHYREVALYPSGNGYWIRFDDHTSPVPGLTTGTNNNRWVDGPYSGDALYNGEPALTKRGVHYNA